MIVVGMNLLAIIFAAVGYAAVRVANGSPRLVLKRQRRLFFWTGKKSFPTFYKENVNEDESSKEGILLQ